MHLDSKSSCPSVSTLIAQHPQAEWDTIVTDFPVNTSISISPKIVKVFKGPTATASGVWIVDKS